MYGGPLGPPFFGALAIDLIAARNRLRVGHLTRSMLRPK